MYAIFTYACHVEIECSRLGMIATAMTFDLCDLMICLGDQMRQFPTHFSRLYTTLFYLDSGSIPYQHRFPSPAPWSMKAR